VRRILLFSAPLLAALWLAGGPAGAEAKDKATKASQAEVCNGDFGTSVHFEKSPSDAAKRALKEEKLVLVLHISGHFEDSDLT
jgi:hypothetical protein